MTDEERKIIIDEDWKSQVQREKEEALQAAPEADAEDADELGLEEEEGASFTNLISSLATQCMFSLGVIAPQGQERVMVDLGQAKYLIDTLLMLRDKTEGHLTSEEQGHLTEAIAELQRVYVVRAQQVQEAALQNAGIDPKNLKGH